MVDIHDSTKTPAKTIDKTKLGWHWELESQQQVKNKIISLKNILIFDTNLLYKFQFYVLTLLGVYMRYLNPNLFFKIFFNIF